MICVRVLFILLCASELWCEVGGKAVTQEASVTDWLDVLETLPASLAAKATKCVNGNGVECAYIFSKKGEEVKNVIDELFNVLRGSAKDVTSIPAKDRVLSYGLGYMCWSEGRASGLKTIQQQGEPLANTDKDGITMIEVDFNFKELKVTFDKCGFENGVMSKSGKCELNVGAHLFKLRFKVKNITNFLKLLFRALQKECVLSIVDLQVVNLESIGLNVTNSDGAKGKVRNRMIDWFVNINTKLMKRLITRKARTYIYRRLGSDDPYVCKDQSLVDNVESKYKRYLSKPRLGSEEKFKRLCGHLKDPIDSVNSVPSSPPSSPPSSEDMPSSDND